MQTVKTPSLEKKFQAVSLIIAPLLFAASTFFWINGEYSVPSAVCIIFSMFFWIPALTLLFTLIKNKMPNYAVWGLWIAVYGCISGCCLHFLDTSQVSSIYRTRNTYTRFQTIQFPLKYCYLQQDRYFL